MITGEIKNKVDRLWDTFWEKSNIRTPVDVVSHLSYLFFMKMLDDARLLEIHVSKNNSPFALRKSTTNNTLEYTIDY